MINYAIFKNLGLSKKETTIYISVLSHANSSASDIEKITDIGRTYIYDIAQKLVKKGFLQQITKNKKRVFIATSPKEILNKQKKIISDFENNLSKLEELENENKIKRPQIVYYSGKEELSTMMDTFISSKIDKEAIAFSDDSFYLHNEGYHQKNMIKKRITQDVHFRALAGMSTAVMASKKRDEQENRETRLLSKDSFNLKTMFGVHGEKTVVVNYKKNYAFVVEDKDFADTIKEIFNTIWNSGKVIG